MNDARQQDCLLRAAGLTKKYPNGNVLALDDVDLTFRAGEYVAIMGPSGSGKSTLLNMLGALDMPTSGEVHFDGKVLSRQWNLDRYRSQEIGFVFQSFLLLPTLTSQRNVEIPMFETALTARERKAKARDLLAGVQIDHRANHYPAQLSVGERQRVAVARALANDPRVLLADEPTGNLDSKTGEGILDLFAQLHQERGMTLIVVTHSVEVASRAQRVVQFRDGRVVADMPSSQMAVY